MRLSAVYIATIISILIFEVLMMVSYALLVDYGPGVSSGSLFGISFEGVGDQYPMFQDVHVMVFIGFGLLMTFLSKYGYSSLGLTFLISSIVIQWSILLEGIFRITAYVHTFYVSLGSLVSGDIAAATVLISLGAVVGKISPFQLFYMALIETVFYVCNRFIIEDQLEARDVGGSFLVHVFGAYFGLSVSAVMGFRKKDETDVHEAENSTYQSDINCLIGTLFLWVFWPSFNGAMANGEENNRAIINTYFSLTASCAMVFAMSSMFNKEGKFEMVHIQNATLAGGVCIGSICNFDIQPFGALFVGSCAGIVSVVGYRFLQGCFQKKLHIHDTCGIHNLHGIPGLMGGFTEALLTMFMSKELYGSRYFPAMNPFYHDRSAFLQGLIQLASVGITLGFAIGGGLITGILIAIAFPTVEFGDQFNDSLWWSSQKEQEEPS